MNSRRDFVLGSIGLLTLIPACGPSSNPASPDASSFHCTTMIGGNHGHVLTILASDLASPRDRTYNIQGSADHTHSVSFSAEQMQTLADGGTVTVTSTLGLAHTHEVTPTC